MSTKDRLKKRLQKAQTQSSRRRVDFESESDSDDAEWLGEPLNADTLLKRKSDAQTTAAKSGRRATRGSGFSNIAYYRGFRKGDLEYTLGDCVLLRNDSSSSKFDAAFVAQILKLWESEKGELQGDFRWFHQAPDLDRFRRHHRSGTPIPDNIEVGELAYTLDDDVNAISTVIGKCEVMSEKSWRERYGPGQAKLTKDQIARVWFCRGMVDKKVGYRAIEWTSNRDMMQMKEHMTVRQTPAQAMAAAAKFEATKRTTKSEPSFSKASNNGLSTKRRMPKEVLESSTSSSDESEDESEFEGASGNESDSAVKDKQSVAGKLERASKPTASKRRKSNGLVPVRQGVANSRKTKAHVVHTPTTHRTVPATAPRSDFEHARNRLHVSAVPDSLPCRTDEFEEISNHLESAIDAGSGACIYISGVPGTGKTATVHEVIRSLQAKSEQGDLPPFQFVEINGMKVTEPSYAYVLLWMALSDQKVTANHALQLLEKQFSTPGPRRLPCVVLMDELDLMVTSKQTVMYNFFEWPHWLHSRLIVVAVANTMDLPERMLSNKVASRLGEGRINFQPYTYTQLATIVKSRLGGIEAFRNEAIEFAARKVSAVSGDARRALDICRRAVEIVEADALRKEREREKNGTVDPDQVTIRIVDQAIKEMFASPNIRLVQTASLHQKIFLISLVSRLRRSGTSEVEFSEVATMHIQTCVLQSIEPPMVSDLSAICAGLGASRCLLVESSRNDIHQRVRLNVAEEDVIMALKMDSQFKRLLENLQLTARAT